MPFDLGFTLTVLHATQACKQVQGEVNICPVSLRFKVYDRENKLKPMQT